MAWVAVGVAGASAAYKGYQGYQQKKAGEEALKGLNRPEYKISQQLLDNLSDAEKQQVQGLPAEQKAEFVKNLERSQQNAMKQSASRKGGLLGVQASTSQMNDQYTNLTSMDAAARKESELRKQANIQNARGAIAGAEDKQFAVNQQYYNQDLDSANAMIGAGMQNINQAIDTAGGAAMGAMGTMGGGSGGSGNSVQPNPNAVSTNSFNENTIPQYQPTRY